MSAAMHRLTAAVASLLVFTACPGDSPLTSETNGETSAASTSTSAGETTVSEQPTTGGSSDSGAPDSTGSMATGTTGTTGTDVTGTTGAIDDTGTGGVSEGTEAGEASGTSDDTGGVSEGTDTGETSGGDSSSEGGEESSTGECSELGADAEMTAMELEVVTEGVYFSSESDYLWTVVTLACVGPVTAETIKEVIAPVYVQHDDVPLAMRAVETRTFVEFFDKLTVPQDWWDDGYYAQAEKYKPIRQVLEDNLTDLQVFRLGEQSGNNLSGQIDVIVIGRSGADLVAIMTIAVET